MLSFGAALIAACSSSTEPNDASSDAPIAKDAAVDSPSTKCTSGQTRCSDDLLTTQTCDESGNWQPGLVCQSQTCVSGQCAGSCAPGETQCSGNTLQACDKTGSFATSQSCPVACCSGACVDTGSDSSNCGSCGNACGAGTTCGTSFTAFTGAQSANWVANGSAAYDATDNAAQLTDVAATGETGTWVYANPITIDDATIQFDLFAGGGSGADGMAMMLETNGGAALGGGGGGLGVTGLAGFGVEFDAYDNAECSDASSNHTAIDSLASCGDGVPTTFVENDSPGFTVADGNWHTAIVQIQNGAFTVSVDGISQFSGYSPSGWSNGGYYLGFGGGTGGLTNYHRVRNVSVKFTGGHCY